MRLQRNGALIRAFTTGSSAVQTRMSPLVEVHNLPVRQPGFLSVGQCETQQPGVPRDDVLTLRIAPEIGDLKLPTLQPAFERSDHTGASEHTISSFLKTRRP